MTNVTLGIKIPFFFNMTKREKILNRQIGRKSECKFFFIYIDIFVYVFETSELWKLRQIKIQKCTVKKKSHTAETVTVKDNF